MAEEVVKSFDFEEDRLDIKNFVIDYFEYRIAKEGEEWYESPGLVDGVQKEHVAMRRVASIFEERGRADIQSMTQQILDDSQLAFPRFCDVLDEFNRTESEDSKQMSYGRLVGLMAFSGALAAELIKKNQRREVQQILLYTSTFIGTRIRLTWPTEARSWADFMKFAADICRRREVRKKRDEEDNRRRSRRLSIGIAVGVGVVIAAGVGAKIFR